MIAQALVAHRPEISVLIVAGSPVVGSFSFPPQVDFIRVPGVVKLGADTYAPSNPGLSIEDLTEIRSAIIKKTAEIFDPDVFLVDKEPLGMRGEVGASLHYLKTTGARLVLGLRDIMDEPSRLAEEWRRKEAFSAIEDLYDDIWIYGLPEICDPLDGVGVSRAVREKAVFTGYLQRADDPSGALPAEAVAPGEAPFVLVTTGGGGDGAMLVDWVLRAYESGADLGVRAKIVLGPFMDSAHQSDFQRRVAQLPEVDAITFAASIEPLFEHSVGVVAMGGYNTFCEILSFDKPAVIVPRQQPRLEQEIRARQAEVLGLSRMLDPDMSADAGAMAEAIRALPRQARPRSVAVEGILGGLDAICRLTDEAIAAHRREQDAARGTGLRRLGGVRPATGAGHG
ncbi:glycosyltransferase family protein [Jiella sp. M17.18]|uniref:glycosyltransferase family protein n=1 Tax=Jiella sp. M17.18 TaxID=3234247 RepID=UPI0034DE993D